MTRLHRWLMASSFVAALVLPSRGSACDPNWVLRAPNPNGTFRWSAAAVDGKIFTCGGYVKAVQAYDPPTDSWTMRSDMVFPRTDMAIATVDGVIYAAGGFGDYWFAYPDMQVYVVATDTWQMKTPMPTKRAGAAAATVNGKVYVIGGNMGNVYCGQPALPSAIKTVEAYDIKTDTWSKCAGMNVARANLGAVTVGRTIFAIGGNIAWGVHQVFDDVEAYDTDTKAWSPRAAMPTPRNNFAVAYARGRIYVMGGLDSAWPRLDVVEAFDPSTNTWTTGASLPVPNGFMASAVIGDRIYVLGGEAEPGDVLVGGPDAPAISVAVRRAVEPSPAGGPVSYAVTVCNLGGSLVGGLEITDTVPAALASVSTVQTASLGAPTITTTAAGTLLVWGAAPADLAAGSCLTITITGWLAEVCSPVALGNHAAARGRTACETLEGHASDAVVIMPESNPVTVRVSIAPEHPGVGDRITRQIIVTNSGSAAIRELVVVDTVPGSLLDIATYQPGGFDGPAIIPVADGARYEWSSSSLSLHAGEALAFVVTGRVGASCHPVVVDGPVAVTARTACPPRTAVAPGSGATVAPYSVAAAVTDALTAAEAPDGHGLAYLVTVRNTGTATLEGLTVTDQAAAFLRNLTTQEPPGWTAPMRTEANGSVFLAWTAPGLVMRPGDAFTFTVTGDAATPCADREVYSVAKLEADAGCGPRTFWASPSLWVDRAPARGLALAMRRTPEVPEPGAQVTWTLLVTNRGEQPVDGLTVVDTLPVGVALVSKSGFPNGSAYVTREGTITWTSAEPLAPGATATLWVTGTYACGAGGNAARAFARDGCGALASAPVVDAVPGPALVVTLAHAVSEAADPRGIVFRVLVTNTGIATITHLTVVDSLPASFAPRGWRGPAGMPATSMGRVATWTGPLSLAPGASVTLEAEGTVPCGDDAAVHAAWAAGEAACGVASASAAADGAKVSCPPPPPPPEPSLACGKVKLVGGIRGWLNPKLGEQATILVRTCDPGPIIVRVFDESGAPVAEFTGTARGREVETFQWNLRNAAGSDAPPGIYAVTVEAPGIRFRGRLAVLR